MVTKEENIILHAEKLFADKGYDATSTREIAKAAEINISMIAYYFGSKEKLLEAIFEFRMNQGIEYTTSILGKTDLNAWEKLILILNRYIERVKNLKDFYLILQREQINLKNIAIVEFIKNSKRKFLETYKIILDEGYNDGLFKHQPKVEFIHSTISGTLFSAMNSVSFYKDFLKGTDDFEQEYYENLQIHLSNILKHLLGYEEKP
ncbi:MAG: TetR/AcrR family transcriptional regulator [Bacteroidetes bacterium]|nr:TetR/AcrR family transcriptional regulator [Bacteroidota bacterium]